MSKRIILSALVLTTVFTVGFFGGSKKNAIATVGKQSITLNDLNDRIAAYQNSKQVFENKENKVKVLDQMINELVIYNAALKQGLTKNKDYKQQLENAKRQILINLMVQKNIDSQISVTDQEANTFYSNNKKLYQVEQRRASHVLVDSKKTAYTVLRKAKKGVAFDELAKQFSKDPTKEKGGDLGWFTRGQLLPQFEDAVFKLKKGALSTVVKTNLGYHVIKLNDVRKELPFDTVKNQIKQQLAIQKKRELTTQYVGKLKEKQKITRDISKIN